MYRFRFIPRTPKVLDCMDVHSDLGLCCKNMLVDMFLHGMAQVRLDILF